MSSVIFGFGASMKKIFISFFALLGLIAGPALAADLPVKAPPPPAPVDYWSGLYVGGNAGYVWSNDSVDLFSTPTILGSLSALGLTYPALTAAAATGNFGNHTQGFIGGVQIGYNGRIAPGWIVGVEADFQGITNNNGSTTVTFAQPRLGGPDLVVTTVTASHRITDLGTMRARFGFLPTPNLLLYGTGGLAFGEVGSSNSIATTEQPNTGTTDANTFGSSSSFSIGWTAGAGAEWMFAPNWSTKFEYLHYDLGRLNYYESMTAFLTGVGPAFSIATTASARFNGNIVRVGINYHFGGAPVVAKY
jgi:outer membrane immunogenic protein